MILDNDIDICFVTETWMKRSDPAKMAEIHERGLELFNAPRRGNGGGVGFLFNPKRVHLVRNEIAKYSSFEVLEAVLESTTETLRLCVVYRSTQLTSREKYNATRQAKFFEDFNHYLDCLEGKSGKPLICGDFNFHVERDIDPMANRFKTLLCDRGLIQHVEDPTHFSGGTLDLVLTKSSNADCLELSKMEVTSATGTTSDHFLVSFTIPIFFDRDFTCPRVAKEVREFSKIDPEAFKNDIQLMMPKPTIMTSLDEAVCTYDSVLTDLLDKHAPVKVIKVKEKESPWWNGACSDARREKRRAERMFKKHRSSNELRQQYMEKKVDAAIIIDRNRNNYYTKKLSEAVGDSKATYKIVNTLWDKEHTSIKLPKGCSNEENANNLKNFFHNKVAKIYSDIEQSQSRDEDVHVSSSSNNCSTNNDVPQNCTAKHFKLLLSTDLEKILKSMGTKSCCLDPIPTWLVKNCLPELLPMILLIVNMSLQYGEFPNSLKTAVVRPLLKKANHDSDVLGNYRPISNLSFLSKLIEKCVHLQLTEHIDNNNLFPRLQSGYRKGHSCETAVVKIHNDILMAMDKKNHVILMLVDLSAAFDTINHKKLLQRLRTVYHINGVVLQWLTSYLTNRTFSVSIKGEKSSEAELEIGVPQGSILGPLLFILYTQGLQELAQKYGFSIHLYADDTQIYLEYNPRIDCTKTIEDLKQCFTDIKCWMVNNYLKMNDSKTEIMEIHSLYTSSPPYSSFDLGGCEIKAAEKAKNLGFWFDRSLSLDAQVSNVSKTCYNNMRKLKRIGSKLPKELKIQLVHSCIHSIIDSCNATYFALSQNQLKRLQKLQNTAVRFIFSLKGKDRYQSISPLLKDLHFLPVIYRIRFKVALLTFKCLNNMAPPYLSSMISLRKESSISVRADNDFFLLSQPAEPRCNKTRGAFSYAAPRVWNNLPYSIRANSDVGAFKTALKTYMFNCAFGGATKDSPEDDFV